MKNTNRYSYNGVLLVEKKNHLAVHAIFSNTESANKHLAETIPLYVSLSYFMDKTLTADSFEVIDNRH